PAIYYGDEIGMGDNIYLGDRDGVRTPMQWSGDRNAGFSRADPQKLYMPPIRDPLYGYEGINVEAQERTPTSMLQWLKRVIGIRKHYPVFGRGSIRFLHPTTRQVLAFVREHEGTRVLVTCNLSRFSQAAELDLSEFEGLYPVELFGKVVFPRIGQLPYLLTFGPHIFYWFELKSEEDLH
ncbi:MAG: alpha-glucosidase C-terminal domain-containing protein, partial [Chloroflexia bacterium]|nr:alpha-glucosidase C-terminal domain-containing protein [Chloroflexia bacterium]